eukprot:959860_1
MASSYFWYLVLFLFIHTSHAYQWCVSGYGGSNVYLFGKTTYFQGYDSATIYYYSAVAPVQSDQSVFIWQNTTDHCYTFLTIPDGSRGKNIPIAGMTIHAICSDCTTTVSNLEDCPSWNIIGEGIHPIFTIQDGKCLAENWIINNTLQTPQNQPPDICMHHTDQYRPEYNDINLELFGVDMYQNPYYFFDAQPQYFGQYYDTIHSQWYWIQYTTRPSTHRESIAYCLISGYPNQSIIDCAPWYYQNPSNSSQYLPYDMTIDDHDCAFPSDAICVYDATLPYAAFNKDINGDYSLYRDPNSYEGFSKGTGGLVYIRFVNNTWKFGYNADLDEYIFSTCNNNKANTQINPFDITSCNGYWQLHNQSCCDTLTISNTPCVSRPTRAP